jgi:hypothetical protein
MNNTDPASICPACGAANRCAITRGEAAASCWCQQQAAILPLPAANAASCYCSACLQKLAAQSAAAPRGTINEHKQ